MTKYQLLTIVISALIFAGCHKLVQDEFPDFTRVPTVNSFLVADSTIKVNISLAAKMDTEPLKNVDQAEVKLFVDGIFKETLGYHGNGMYSSVCQAEAGRLYQCKVNIPGYDEVTASDSLPLPNPILKTEHILTAGIDEEGYSYPGIKFTFSNNPKERRYYQAIVWLYSAAEWRSSPWSSAGLKEITDPVLLAEGLPMAVFSNDKIRGDSYTMQINYQSGIYFASPNNQDPKLYPFKLEMRSISYHYYEYLRQIFLYNLGRYPEFPGGVTSVFPLHTNIQNGYGIFAGYSSSFSAIIQPE